MIIRLMNANFSANNIGELNKFTVKCSGTAVSSHTFTTPVDKETAISGEVTLNSGFNASDVIVIVKMGGTPITDNTSLCTINRNTTGKVTITIPSVTGNVNIQVGEAVSGGGSGDNTPTVEGIEYTNSGFYNNSDGSLTSPNASWYYSELIPLSALADNESGYCTTMLQAHSKVAMVAYYSSTDLSSYLGYYGSTTQGETAQYSAEEVKSNAPEGAVYVGFSTHSSQKPFKVYMTV